MKSGSVGLEAFPGRHTLVLQRSSGVAVDVVEESRYDLCGVLWMMPGPYRGRPLVTSWRGKPSFYVVADTVIDTRGDRATVVRNSPEVLFT